MQKSIDTLRSFELVKDIAFSVQTPAWTENRWRLTMGAIIYNKDGKNYGNNF